MGLIAALCQASAWAAITVNSVDVPSRIGRGQTVTVTLEYVRSSGAGPEAIVTDTTNLLSVVSGSLPSGCVLAGAPGTAQQVTCTVNPATGVATTLAFSVTGFALGGSNINAAATVSAANSFTVAAGGDLTVAKAMAPSTTVTNGQTVTFTLTPGMAGDTIPAGGSATVTDQLPGTSSEFQLTAINAPGYSCTSVGSANTSRRVDCVANGPTGALGAITLTGRSTLNGAGGLVNNASIAADGTNYIDIDPNNNTASVSFTVNPGADPRPTGSFSSPAITGQAQNLTINYVNGGPQSTVGGQLRVAIPVDFAIGTLPAGCAADGAGTVNGVTGNRVLCTTGTVASGGTQSFALPLTPGAVGTGNFGVEVVTGVGNSLPGGLTDADPSNNQALVPFTVEAPFADLTISKGKTSGPLEPGDTITSNITVTNSGMTDAVYSGDGGATPLRVVDTLPVEEEYVSASAGWTCTDSGPGVPAAGQHRVTCLRTAGGTLAVGGSLALTLTTRVTPGLVGQMTLTNTACTGAQVLTNLGLTPADGPQPPARSGACVSRSVVATDIGTGQAQASVRKESSIDGTTWIDSAAAAPTLAAASNTLFWRITITTPSVGVNPAQRDIPTLEMRDNLPGILNIASPGAGIPGYTTPGFRVAGSVLTGSASGACLGTYTMPAASDAFNCAFTTVTPGTTLQFVLEVDRPVNAGLLTNVVNLSSPDAVLTASAGGALSDDAAITVQSRTDVAVTSKTVNPPNSATAPRIGQNISYTIVARNLGPGAIQGPITVTDTLDATRVLVTGVSAVGSGASPAMTCSFNAGTGAVSCATGGATSVARYDFYTVTVNARLLKVGLPGGGGGVVGVPLVNTASVALDSGQNCEWRDGSSAACNDAASTTNNSASASIDIKVPAIDLVQKKARVLPSGQTSFGLTDTLRYRLRVQNAGQSRAEAVQVTDRLNVPAGYTLTFNSVMAVNSVAADSGFTLDTDKTTSTVSCSQAGGNADVVCTLAGGAAGYLDQAKEVNLDLGFTLTGPSAVVSVGNTARACADETTSYETNGACVFTPSGTAGNNIATVNDVIFPISDLSLAKQRVTASPVGVGQPVEYLLTLRNLGVHATTQMRVADVLPPNFEWVTGGANTPSATVGGFAGLSVSNVSCSATPATLTAPGQTQTVNCIVNGQFPGNAAANNTVLLRLFTRPSTTYFAGPFNADRTNTATISPGQDGSGNPLTIDSVSANNSASATVQVVNATASLAGTVFVDTDRSGANGGVPQGGETRLAGVTVRLTGTNTLGQAVNLSTTTDASGNYQFNGLMGANGAGYTLTQTQPTGYRNGPVDIPASGGNAPSVGGTYSAGGSSGASTISGIALANAQAGVRYNFPELAVVSLSGNVYLDRNLNDQRDPGSDPPIANARVRLLDGTTGALLQETLTDAGGAYRFDDLDPLALYQLEEPLPTTPAGLGNGPVHLGRVGGSACTGCAAAPNTPAAGTDRITAIDLSNGSGTDFDFGERQVTRVSGSVYLDRDDSRTRTEGDPPLAGVTLHLVQGADCATGQRRQSTQTDASGAYLFENVGVGGSYLVCQVQPLAYGTVVENPGTAATVAGSNAIAITSVPLGGSAGNHFGEKGARLQGQVWLDRNDDGQRQSDEPGLPGVPVLLTGTDNQGATLSRSATTDAEGGYRFDELPAAGAQGYSVSQSAEQPSYQGQPTLNGRTVAGSSGGQVTSVLQTPSSISAIALPAGGQSLANDFAEIPAGALAGIVYADHNDDGRVDAHEPGLPGVPVLLTGTDDLNRPVQLETSTGLDGRYRFDGLRPGTYTVTEPQQPADTLNGKTTAGVLGGQATPVAVTPSAIAGVVLPLGGQALENNFGELIKSPDLRVSKRHEPATFTVNNPGRYLITVRNSGFTPTVGSYTVRDRLPTGLLLAGTPSGTGWTCTGAANASTFECTRASVLAPGEVLADRIQVPVLVTDAAVAASPVVNPVLVEGGGEIEARAPTPAEREAFNGNPAALPLCSPAVEHNACKDPTPVQRAASLSGTVWLDLGRTPQQLDSGDRVLPGWIVELVDPQTGAVLRSATTGSGGTYRFDNLIPGVEMQVRFRDPASNVVFGYPVNGESGPGSSGARCQASLPSSCVGTGHLPALTVKLAPGEHLPQQSLPVDPSGVVYDSGSREPVAGAIVTLAPIGACSGYDPAQHLVGATLGGYTLQGQGASMRTGADGFYQYLFAPSAPASCRFGLTVAPPAPYTWPSQVIPPQPGPLIPPGGPGSTYAVQPQPEAPREGLDTRYFLDLVSGSAGANIIHNHIPVDPGLPASLSLSKSGDRAVVELGDSVRYRIVVRAGPGNLPRQTTVVDRLPAGFTYIAGTAMVGNQRVADPQGGLGPVLTFQLGRLPASREATLHYRVRVGVGAQQGDGVNRAQAVTCGTPAGCVNAARQPVPGSLPSNEARHAVRVAGGLFGVEACVLGKVFVDCNHNHVQDPEELGVPGVRLVVSDGTLLVSDSEGKYSLCGVRPQSHVLRVDESTLPRGSRLTTSSSRNLGDAGSLWLDVKNGELHRADVVLGSCSNGVLDQVKARRAQGEVRAPEAEKKALPPLRFDSKAHGRTRLTTPEQGSDSANQPVPKPRTAGGQDAR